MSLIVKDKDALAKALCTLCFGKGWRMPYCSACEDSTLDHECPDAVECNHPAAVRRIQGLLDNGLLADAETAVHTIASAIRSQDGRVDRGWILTSGRVALTGEL